MTVSQQVLYSQFDGMKMLASKGKDKVTRPMKMWGELYRVLHLVPDALASESEVKEEAAAAQDDDLAATGL